jgi:hypothetical protein
VEYRSLSPIRRRFSPDDQYLYAYGDGLKIFNRSYVHVGDIAFDSGNVSDNPVFTTNSDGSVLIVIITGSISSQGFDHNPTDIILAA